MMKKIIPRYFNNITRLYRCKNTFTLSDFWNMLRFINQIQRCCNYRGFRQYFNERQIQITDFSKSLSSTNLSIMLNGKEHENKTSQSCNKADSDKQSSISSTGADADTSNLSSSL